MSHHNLYSPSSAHIWSKCILSAKLQEEHGLDKQNNYSFASAKGNDIHDIFEIIMNEKITSGSILSKDDVWKNLKEPLITKPNIEEFSKYYKIAIEAVNEVIENIDPKYDYPIVHCEQYGNNNIKVGAGIQNIGGTADLVYIQSELNLTGFSITVEKVGIYDLKSGLADRISAYKNDQLILYAAPWIKFFTEKNSITKETKIELGILQPPRENYSYWQLSREELNQHYEKIIRRLKQQNYKPSLGDSCKYCKVKTVCPALRKSLSKIMECIS
ncbi:MAG: DUF2800 domain-containing protein [Gammaproteobacteria bacterium]